MKCLSMLALPVLLVACSAPRASTSSLALGMVRSPQDSDSSFKGKPGEDGQDSSFQGKPQQDDPTATPAGAGFNQAPGEMRPQMGGGDIHYHVHYHGNAQPSPTVAGYSAPVYGAPVATGNLGQFNNGTSQAPLGTGGGGAGWYGPSGDGGPGGIRQGFGVGGWGTAGGYGNPANNGNWNGYTD